MNHNSDPCSCYLKEEQVQSVTSRGSSPAGSARYSSLRTAVCTVALLCIEAILVQFACVQQLV